MNLELSFQQALNAFNGGDLDAAANVCNMILAQAPSQADTHHLMALVCKGQGKLRMAESHFRASLMANDRQPVVHSNLGNLLQQSRRFNEAEVEYDRALKLMPNLADAWFNRGKMALQQGRSDKAIYYLEKARSAGAKINADLTLIKAYQEAGELQQAKNLSETLYRYHPQDVRSIASVAKIKYQNDDSAAFRFLESRLSSVSEPATIYYEMGLLSYANDEFEAAISQFQAALDERPDMINAHRSLNNLLWQQEDERFLTSYRQAIEKLPMSGALYHNLAAAHISAGQEQQALSVLQEAVKRAGRDPFLVHGLAVQELKQDNFSVAHDLMQEALRTEPDNINFLIGIANLDIKTEKYKEAANYLTQALAIEPHNQEVWAYQGLLWRLTNDARHDWLNDYDKLLKEYELPVPKGFPNLPAFMTELGAYLTTLHTSKRQPLDQSVRNGTQSLGMLFKDTNQLIVAIRKSVMTVLNEYLSGMKTDSEHPFYSRLTKSTRFTGSWSVKLGEGGFHTNHMHPYGWLSCCNYVSLPPLGEVSGGERAGWIRFGETSLQLGERELVARAIQPEVGKCVFFPSYFWHGTYAFSSQIPRMTVPCDIDPV